MQNYCPLLLLLQWMFFNLWPKNYICMLLQVPLKIISLLRRRHQIKCYALLLRSFSSEGSLTCQNLLWHGNSSLTVSSERQEKPVVSTDAVTRAPPVANGGLYRGVTTAIVSLKNIYSPYASEWLRFWPVLNTYGHGAVKVFNMPTPTVTQVLFFYSNMCKCN